MPLYECVLIARNDVTQQQVEGIADGIDLEGRLRVRRNEGVETWSAGEVHLWK